MWSPQWHNLITQIHQQHQPAVLVVTGGGASAIAELLAVPGASRTILDAQVPYSSEALIAWLGRRPDQFCDERTALAMASVAAYRAGQLLAKEATASDIARPFGISCTASLASDRPKRGDHRCFIALQSDTMTASYALTLKKGARSRAEEEALVGQLIVRSLAAALGLTNLPDIPLRPTEIIQTQFQAATESLSNVWKGAAQCVWSWPDGSFAAMPPVAPQGLLCGAFDPLHCGHEELRRTAERRLGGLVAYEISVTNVDKPPLDFLTIERRRRQFQDVPLALTNAPRFWQKAQIYPGVTFVVGSDTAIRIMDAKYYGGDADALRRALQQIRQTGCRFLVATRALDGRVLALPDLKVPDFAKDLFEEIPEAEFRVDISSTDLRCEHSQASVRRKPDGC